MEPKFANAMIALAVSIWSTQALAHGGGLNAEGCHTNRKTGDYHCHRGGGSGRSSSPERPLGLIGNSGAAPFPNCSAARAAGAAPVYAGTSGYGRWLDRDGDGVGCE